MRLGGSLALPISTGFEFFHTFRGVGVGLSRGGPTPKAGAFDPSQEGNQQPLALASVQAM